MDITKCSLDVLGDILHDIYTWRYISTKYDDIYNAISVLKSVIRPYTKLSKDSLSKIDDIEKICTQSEEQFEKNLKTFGIYDGNIEDKEEEIIIIIKQMMITNLKIEMKNNKNARVNMNKYVDEYFEQYDIRRRTNDLQKSIKIWIENRQAQKN